MLSWVHAHTFSLSPSLWYHLFGQPRPSVSRLSSCDNPTPLYVNSCTYRQWIGRAYRGQRLPCIMPTIFVSLRCVVRYIIFRMPKGHFFRLPSFVKYVKSNVNIFNTRVNIFLQIDNILIICIINCFRVVKILKQIMK